MLPKKAPSRLVSGITLVLFGLAGVWLLASPWSPTRGGLQITTSVLLRSRIERMVYPTYLHLGPEDVQRGWIELPDGSQLTVYNNCRAGYLLVFETVNAPWIEQFQVSIQGADVQLPAAGGMLLVPWEGAGRKGLQLSYRFNLRTGTTPGIYPWPLQIAAQPAIAQ